MHSKKKRYIQEKNAKREQMKPMDDFLKYLRIGNKIAPFNVISNSIIL